MLSLVPTDGFLIHFRSSLPPEIVEALICAQGWFRVDPESVTVEEHSSEN